LPLGGAVEGVSFSAMLRAGVGATRPDDREHVTTFIRRHPEVFPTVTLAAPRAARRPDVRLTIDTPDDLARMRALFERAGTKMPSIGELIAAHDALRAAA
jgi:spore coat polysaccharide biosynthesis protein SpsF